jgi:hypothetical protein
LNPPDSNAVSNNDNRRVELAVVEEYEAAGESIETVETTDDEQVLKKSKMTTTISIRACCDATLSLSRTYMSYSMEVV